MDITFTRAHLEAFALASHDVNPLHLSEGYARATPFGDTVVYGSLGALACLAAFRPPEGMAVEDLQADFRRPLQAGVPYRIAWISPDSDRAAADMTDGSTLLIRLALKFRPGVAERWSWTTAPEMRKAAARLEEADLQPGLELSGPYLPPLTAYRTLLDGMGVDRAAWGDNTLVALLLASYITGMELPGERAMFFRLKARFAAGGGAAPFARPPRFHAGLTGYDERLGLVKSGFTLAEAGSAGPRDLVAGELQAFLRPARPVQSFDEPLPERLSGAWNGKTALVVGGSRGLGAAFGKSLAAAGAHVICTYARSREDALHLAAAAAGLPGRIVLEQGDSSSLEWCLQIRRRLLDPGAGLDLLVCSAAPSLHALKLEPAQAGRIDEFIRTGIRMVAHPLAAWLEPLARASGTLLLVSSSAVEEPVAAWPHYVALKAAAEGLARVAALQYPQIRVVIARPGKILTDLVNTPTGRFNAEPAVRVAHRLLAAALDARSGDRVRWA